MKQATERALCLVFRTMLRRSERNAERVILEDALRELGFPAFSGFEKFAACHIAKTVSDQHNVFPRWAGEVSNALVSSVTDIGPATDVIAIELWKHRIANPGAGLDKHLHALLPPEYEIEDIAKTMSIAYFFAKAKWSYMMGQSTREKGR